MFINLFWIVFVLDICSLVSVGAIYVQDQPDEDRNSVQLIESRGFKSQTHFIQTQDGYILQTFRIINPLPPKEAKFKPVLLAHGLYVDSDMWLLNANGTLLSNGDYIEPFRHGLEVRRLDGKYKSVGNTLPFVLSQFGFDVWIMNSRGNYYSQSHVRLKSSDEEFWKFSNDEIALLDLPATLDYILSVTKKPDLGYIGISLGSQIMLQLLSTTHKYDEIIKPAILMAPQAYVHLTNLPLIQLLHLLPTSDYNFISGQAIPPYLGQTFKDFGVDWVCKNFFLRYSCIAGVMFSIGSNFGQIEADRIAPYLKHVPSGGSLGQVVHFLQNIQHERFSMFDYGEEENLKRYGRKDPPEYQLGKIRSKHLVIFNGENDKAVPPRGVQELKKHLKVKLFDDYLVPHKSWNHIDFVTAKDAGKYINTRIIDLLRATER